MENKVNLDTITKYSIIIGMVLISLLLLYEFIILPRNKETYLEKKEKFVECSHQLAKEIGRQNYDEIFDICFKKCEVVFNNEKQLKELISLNAGAIAEELTIQLDRAEIYQRLLKIKEAIESGGSE